MISTAAISASFYKKCFNGSWRIVTFSLFMNLIALISSLISSLIPSFRSTLPLFNNLNHEEIYSIGYFAGFYLMWITNLIRIIAILMNVKVFHMYRNQQI